MLLLKRLFSLTLLCFTFLFSNKAMGSDFELWTFVGGEAKIKNAQLFFHNANFFRAQDNWFLNHIQVTYDFTTHKTLFVGIGYKQEYVKFPGKWRAEYRPFARLFYQKQTGNWHFLDKNQYEMRIFDKESIHRYRNQIIVLYKKLEGATPFFMTEFFVNLKGFDYNRQRIFVGSFIPAGNINFNLFIGPEINKIDAATWKSTFVFGTGLSYKF